MCSCRYTWAFFFVEHAYRCPHARTQTDFWFSDVSERFSLLQLNGLKGKSTGPYSHKWNTLFLCVEKSVLQNHAYFRYAIVTSYCCYHVFSPCVHVDARVHVCLYKRNTSMYISRKVHLSLFILFRLNLSFSTRVKKQTTRLTLNGLSCSSRRF